MGNGADVFVKVKIKIAIDVEVQTFTRADVLEKLYENVSSVAKVFGPYSDEVAVLEEDIEEVKNGADLADFEWLFPEVDEMGA